MKAHDFHKNKKDLESRLLELSNSDPTDDNLVEIMNVQLGLN